MVNELRVYRTKTHAEPFTEWLSSLEDLTGRAHIATRLNRIALGHFGDCSAVGEGVYELRVHYGPGYRIYFATIFRNTLMLLFGGSKRTQDKDIRRAKLYWSDFKERSHE